MRLGEIVRRGVDIAAVELVLVGKGDGVDDEIERAPCRFHRREGGVDGRGLGHVAMPDDDPVDLLRQWLDPLLQRIALIGEGQIGALIAA